MGLTILISTRPQAAQVIEQLISRWLPRDCWNLHAQSEGGCRWRLLIEVDPCAEPVAALCDAVMKNDWLTGLDFSE